MPKIIYVLTNVAMPTLVKIGSTTRRDVKKRVAELSRPTGVPLPFQCHFAGDVTTHAGNVERLVQELFSKDRVPSGKEFFTIDPEQAVIALKLAGATDVTPQFETKPKAEESRAIKVVEGKRRSKAHLSELGIRPGSQLTLSRDHKVKCKVLADHKVEFLGKPMSLSAAAVRALRNLGYTTSAASGPHYWLLKGKTIGQIRREKEQS